MRVVNRLGLMLLAVCAFSALAVSSASASPQFLAHPPGLITASAGNTQVFITKAGSVECSALKLLAPGDVTVALVALSILAIIDYEKCKVFGLPAVVHPVRYLIDANGSVLLENTVLILAESECVVTVPANQNLSKVEFTNNANGTVLLNASVKGIKSEGTGGPAKLCEYGSESIGTYTGKTLIKPTTGTIRWDP